MICQIESSRGSDTEITIDINDFDLPGMMYLWNNINNIYMDETIDKENDNDIELKIVKLMIKMMMIKILLLKKLK